MAPIECIGKAEAENIDWSKSKKNGAFIPLDNMNLIWVKPIHFLVYNINEIITSIAECVHVLIGNNIFQNKVSLIFILFFLAFIYYCLPEFCLGYNKLPDA